MITRYKNNDNNILMQLKPCITTPGRRFTAPLPRLFRETTEEFHYSSFNLQNYGKLFPCSHEHQTGR